MSEVQFRAGKNLLRGHFHYPATSVAQLPGVLIIPGFADTAVGPHNMHCALARALTEAGLAVLRFDYHGQGESEGDFRDFTAQSGLGDARAALEVLRMQAGVDAKRLGAIGFSLGAALACSLAAEVASVQVLTLLAPVAYPQSVFRTFFSPQHLEQAELYGWMDWHGWAVGGEYLPSLSTLEPLKALKCAQAATLVMQGTEDIEVLPENGEAYAAHGASIHWLKGGDHQFSSVYLQEEIIQKTVSWFQAHWKLPK
ncbi:alpha/beta fold hydrolase [Ktedonosporobacter rubrisoli]|uniref:Alpha/beta fold hydrolase n=1 Tax=Ktedonosporobacter rubrisoli TaxID=2509675 RepID=A0A4P6JQU8_KTERU|nr:alpha/beta fold hydrolase [Ktedonosporobacter rubrisoli]QBD77146.1 alpha/beta fold hydrolase [Ktedonosporobacter rubrisoli]